MKDSLPEAGVQYTPTSAMNRVGSPRGEGGHIIPEHEEERDTWASVGLDRCCDKGTSPNRFTGGHGDRGAARVLFPTAPPDSAHQAPEYTQRARSNVLYLIVDCDDVSYLEC